MPGPGTCTVGSPLGLSTMLGGPLVEPDPPTPRGPTQVALEVSQYSHRPLPGAWTAIVGSPLVGLTAMDGCEKVDPGAPSPSGPTQVALGVSQ